jgi:hypothetical protein
VPVVKPKFREHPLGRSIYIRNDGERPLRLTDLTPAQNVELLTKDVPPLSPGALAVIRYRLVGRPSGHGLEYQTVPPGSTILRIATDDPRMEAMGVKLPPE